MKQPIPIIFGLALLLVLSCNKAENNSEQWSIPTEEIFDGGPGKDGIPSVDNPNFATTTDITYMNDDDLIIGFKNGTSIKGYTHPVLDWHEIINDDIGNVSVAITYCPLTGTAIRF